MKCSCISWIVLLQQPQNDPRINTKRAGYYLTKIVIRFAFISEASFPDNLIGCLGRRPFERTAEGRFSLKAANRIHHVESERLIVGSLFLLYIKHHNYRLLLPFLLPFRLLLLIDLTPSVFALPLSLVTTPVFAGTELALAFFGMLAFVSTIPSRWALALLAFDVLFALSVVAQPVKAAAITNNNANACMRRIAFLVPPRFVA